MVGQNIGQYKVLEPLARGGMGSLYRAIDETLGREVALKILDGDVDDDAARFRAEATCLARLSHPGIATVYELLEYHDRPVMAMELLQGRSLQDILEQVGVFAPDRAAAICIEILNALDHAHAAGIVHRDVKPSNLMMTSSGAIKIMDFGIARMAGTVHLTHVGFLMGSPAYMAPEQVEGRPVDARTDLYAMGVVFYRLLSADLPFKGDTPLDMAQSQVNDAPIPIEQARPDVPEWAGAIITRALAKDPAQRFQSARAMSDAFAHAIATTPAVAAPVIDGATEAMAIPAFSTSAAAAPSAVPVAPPRGAQTSAPKSSRTSGRLPVQQRLGNWLGAAAAAAVVGGVMWFGMPSRETRVEAGPQQPSGVTTPASVPAEAPISTSSVLQNPAPPSAAAQTPPPLKAAPKTSSLKLAARPSTASPAPAPIVRGPVAPVSFTSVKLMKLVNDQASTLDIVLQFHDGELIAYLPGGADPVTRVPYSGIASATYVYAKDPQWNEAASAPGKRVNVPGIVVRKRHWLVLQTQHSYAILQLDNDNWSDVLKTFEARTGVAVGRPLDPAKTRQAGLPNR